MANVRFTVPVERIVIFGSPGSGKSTLAREVGAALRLPVLERDAPGPLGSPEYLAAVRDAIRADRWVFDGAPYYLDSEVYARADTVLVLSYPKRVVLWRVLKRSLRLAWGGHVSGAHAPAGVRAWLRSDHAVRVASTMHAQRRAEGEALASRPELAGDAVLRFSRPAHTRAWLETLQH